MKVCFRPIQEVLNRTVRLIQSAAILARTLLSNTTFPCPNLDDVNLSFFAREQSMPISRNGFSSSRWGPGKRRVHVQTLDRCRDRAFYTDWWGHWTE
jgi:hypothetical protein